MSKLEELIQKYCPDGVEWKPLFELGDFYSGLTGKTKEDFRDGNAKFITYVNIFNNPSLKTDVEEKVKIAPDEKQNTVQYGDALFTGSSETPDECGMCSVLTHQTDEKLYLNSFCFGFRFFDLSDKCPSFMKHLFRSTSIRKAICRTANGVTRFNVSKKEFAIIEIPLPPLPVQEEIGRQLDIFAELHAELQAELQKRLQQYNYYRDYLLSFEDRSDVEWKKVGDVCTVYTGGEVPVNSIKGSEPQGDMIYPIWGNGKDVYGFATTYQIDQDAVCVSSIGANTGAVFFHQAFFTPIIRLKVLIPKDDYLSARYLFHALTVIGFEVKKSSVPNMNANEVKQKAIPVPPLEEQEKIVSILDRFDALTKDLSAGLPAEIEKRRQQYEFYRDKLLTFKKAE